MGHYKLLFVQVLDTKREHIMLWRHLRARYVKLDIIRTADEVTCLQLELYGCSGDEEKGIVNNNCMNFK